MWEGEKCLDNTWIELLSALVRNLSNGLCQRPGCFIGPLVGQGIEDIGYGHDAPFQRDLFAG
jgi:hypothetical protein